MSKESPAKFKIKGIDQIAIVVEDLELVAGNYWSILGIGPWAIFDWEAPLVYDRKYHGKTVWAREKIAITQLGNVMLELVQPVDGPSIYRDWLDEKGEGIHHVNFLVDDVDETGEILMSMGFPSIQSGRFGPPEQKGAYNYIDIEPLRTIWEPAHIGEEIGAVPRMFPDTDEESPSKIKIKGIDQLAIAVENLELVAENYWNIMGIGPWSIFDWEEPLVYDRKYRGETAWAREKIAIVMVDNMMLELVQPVDGPSIYRDFLDERGEGFHHVNFLVDDVDDTAEILTGMGFPSIQSGRFGPPDQKGAYNYFEIEPLRMIWEPAHIGETIGVEPRMHP